MNRQTLTLALVLLAVAGAVFLWVTTREKNPPEEQRVAMVAPSAPLTSQLTPPAPAESETAQVSADDVTRWTAEATDGDAAKRAAALTGLARAPVEQALPVLRRALLNGEPVVDRRIALQSLRDLALERGDPVSAIRNAIREAIYHGDDQTMTDEAQEAIDVIEEGLAK